MFQKRSLSLVVLFIAGLLLTACGGGAPSVDWTLSISGEVGTPIDVSYAVLAKMDHIDLKDVLMQKSLGEDEVASWVGVPLATLFEQAGVGDFSTVTATAGDGYAVEITSDELEGAIVALKKDGDWITKVEPDKGPIRLVCPETPANRWVFQIQGIQVNP